MGFPFVLHVRDQLNSWPSVLKTPEGLVMALRDRLLKIRIGPKSHVAGKVLWEADCQYVSGTMKDFVDWVAGATDPANPLKPYSPDDWWCYIDYKEMFDLFDDSVLEAVDWSLFGLEDRTGLDSTFWCGSGVSYTPCHYDTYGFNLVAQLYGKKRWTLFPPSDTAVLRPTRIPYEESSVFSEVDILSVPDELKHSHPHVVTLEPGDVLFVPSNWWHFVQCIDTSITVNTWVPIPTDADVQVNEAIVRALVHSFTGSGEKSKTQLINPTEPLKLSSEELFGTVEQLIKSQTNLTESSQHKHQRLDDAQVKFFNNYCAKGVKVAQISFEELKNVMSNTSIRDESDGNPSRQCLNSDDFLNALAHPETVKVVRSLITAKVADSRSGV